MKKLDALIKQGVKMSDRMEGKSILYNLFNLNFYNEDKILSHLIDKKIFVKMTPTERSQVLMDILPQMYNIDQEKQKKFLFSLVQMGLDQNVRDGQGKTLLMHLFEFHRMNELTCPTQILDACIQKGADINATDKFGRTALIIAAQSRPHPDGLRFLLANSKTDLHIRDKSGMSFLDYYATMNMDPDRKSQRIMRPLLQAVKNVDDFVEKLELPAAQNPRISDVSQFPPDKLDRLNSKRMVLLIPYMKIEQPGQIGWKRTKLSGIKL